VLGQRIRELRKSKGISSRELAKSLGKGEAYISQIETGKNKNPDKTIIQNILMLLGVSKSELNDIVAQYELPSVINFNNEIIDTLTGNLLTAEDLKIKQQEDAEKLLQIIKAMPSETISILLEKMRSEKLL
jgi:transcriptional regulator with XRE-family HTH domain